jgi:hypothetical protein
VGCKGREKGLIRLQNPVNFFLAQDLQIIGLILALDWQLQILSYRNIIL